LVNCSVALEQKRYTWRHDSVLVNVEAALRGLANDANAKTPTCFATATLKSYKASFVRKGQQGRPKPKQVSSSLMECANDWEVRVDFDHRKVEFPAFIVATSLRPDIVIWSRMSRIVILIELTCGAEEGMDSAQARKGNEVH
jgi:hypothetical protein